MTPGFSLRQLSYLVAIADHGTMTAAAAVCHVSQAAVSVGIIDLERQLGVQLLARHRGHGVTLTEVGAEVVRDARRLSRAVSDQATTTRYSGAGGVTGLHTSGSPSRLTLDGQRWTSVVKPVPRATSERMTSMFDDMCAMRIASPASSIILRAFSGLGGTP